MRVEGASVNSESGPLGAEVETADVGADEKVGLCVGRVRVRVRVRWCEEELWIGEALTVEALVVATVAAAVVETVADAVVAAAVVEELDEEPDEAPVYKAGPGIT